MEDDRTPPNGRDGRSLPRRVSSLAYSREAIAVRRRKPSPTTIIALAALFVALGGTAIAANRYIITSTSQIKPSVLKELRARATASFVKLAASGAHAVRARARSLGPIDSATEPSATSDPLSGGAWKQTPEELNQLLGEVTLTVPSRSEDAPTACNVGTGAGIATLHLKVLLDGVFVGEAHATNPLGHATGEPETVPIVWASYFGGLPSTWLFEPGAPTNHVLTAQAEDDCGVNGGQATDHFTINSVSIDVVGLK
jgi:hypothetical protein